MAADQHDCYRCAYEQAAQTEDAIGRALLLGGRMFLCPTCGNKRCPKATDHRHDCTDSNEPGQVGSNYGVPFDIEGPSVFGRDAGDGNGRSGS